MILFQWGGCHKRSYRCIGEEDAKGLFAINYRIVDENFSIFHYFDSYYCYLKNKLYICGVMDAKQLSILFKRAKEFAKSQGLNYISFRKEWNGSAVYFVSESSANSVSYGGYPSYVLASIDLNVRMATFEEVNEILAS